MKKIFILIFISFISFSAYNDTSRKITRGIIQMIGLKKINELDKETYKYSENIVDILEESKLKLLSKTNNDLEREMIRDTITSYEYLTVKGFMILKVDSNIYQKLAKEAKSFGEMDHIAFLVMYHVDDFDGQWIKLKKILSSY